jgi:hypothetical protein
LKLSRVLTLLVVLAFASLACNFPDSVTPTVGLPPDDTLFAPTWTPLTESPQPPTPSVPPLTAEMLRGGTYVLPESKETVTLVNGKFDRADSMDNILHVELRDPIAFGDLNGDGAEDAAIVLSENMGGTGFFMSVVAILNNGGAPLQGPSRFLDDRAQLNGLTIIGGRIAVDAVIHGFDGGDVAADRGHPDPDALYFARRRRRRAGDNHHRPGRGRFGQRLGADHRYGDHLPV